MDGKKLVEYLNWVSGGTDVYGFDEQSNKVIVIERDNANGAKFISIDKAYDELKELTYNMMEMVKEIFKDLVEEKQSHYDVGGKGNGV